LAGKKKEGQSPFCYDKQLRGMEEEKKTFGSKDLKTCPVYAANTD